MDMSGVLVDVHEPIRSTSESPITLPPLSCIQTYECREINSSKSLKEQSGYRESRATESRIGSIAQIVGSSENPDLDCDVANRTSSSFRHSSLKYNVGVRTSGSSRFPSQMTIVTSSSVVGELEIVARTEQTLRNTAPESSTMRGISSVCKAGNNDRSTAAESSWIPKFPMHINKHTLELHIPKRTIL